MINKIKDIFKKCGIENFGICSFLKIQDKLINCAAKRKIPQNAKSVIMFVFGYKAEEEKPLNISRYAAVEDYHIICNKKLEEIAVELSKSFTDNKFIGFCDNSPVPEVYAAASAGLGIIGKNNLLITPKYGSYVFIGEIITDLEISTSSENFKSCLKCDKCLNSCPTGFLKDKKNTCLSDITQQKRDLTDEQITLIKTSGCVWGCDICQEICPMNEEKSLTNISEFISSYRQNYYPDENSENRAYNWRGENIIKRNYKIIND